MTPEERLNSIYDLLRSFEPYKKLPSDVSELDDSQFYLLLEMIKKDHQYIADVKKMVRKYQTDDE